MKKLCKGKKILALMLAFVVISLENVVIYAQDTENELNTQFDLNEIINKFEENFSSSGVIKVMSGQEIEKKADNFLAKYEESIVESGYQPYIIFSENYEQQQQKLNTSFESMGLNQENTYLVLIGDENRLKSSTGYSYSYIYNGLTYTLRNFTIIAADDSSFEKASSADVLHSSSSAIIENCLNTAIISYISSVSKTLGTVASICGLNISMFAPYSEATLYMNCGTNWTRVYNQVYDSGRDEWVSGSCVEFAKVKSYMSGYYYNASSNSMTSVDKIEKSSVLYSSNYSNNTWRNQQAIIYFNNSNGVCYNLTGDVRYSYGGTVKVTHREDF